MTVATAQISDSLQMLIDSRLDTIDRMLLGAFPARSSGDREGSRVTDSRAALRSRFGRTDS